MSVADLLAPAFSRKQRDSIHECAEAPIALWYGAVSAGKTIASLWAFLGALRRAPRTGIVVIVGRSLQTVYQNIFAPLQNPAIMGPVADAVHYTPGATRAVILGREVMIVGANNVAAVGRIQGSTVVLAYVDEAALLPEEFWNMLVSRGRVEGSRILATMNPASKNHWMRREWITKAADKGVVHFHFTMDDNPTLSDEYKARMKRSYAGVFYDRMILGLWTNAAGAVYPMWDPDRHVIPFEKTPPIRRVIGTGIDFGTSNPTAALMLGLTAEPRTRLVFLDEHRYDPRDHHGARLAPSTQARDYKKWLAATHHPKQLQLPDPEFQVLDPAAAHFQEELIKVGIVTWHGDNDVIAGIATISRLLEEDRLIVTDRCPGWTTEVTEYQWDEKATAEGRDEPVKENDHSLDAGRYIAHTARHNYDFEIAA